MPAEIQRKRNTHGKDVGPSAPFGKFFGRAFHVEHVDIQTRPNVQSKTDSFHVEHFCWRGDSWDRRRSTWNNPKRAELWFARYIVISSAPFHVEHVDIQTRPNVQSKTDSFHVEQTSLMKRADRAFHIQGQGTRASDCFTSNVRTLLHCSTWNNHRLFQNRIAAPRETSCILHQILLSFRGLGDSLARIIAVANQKGGVGKTTTAVNLAACLAASEQPTLLVDCDSQANATAAIGFAKDPARRTLYHCLILNEAFDKIVQKSQVDGLDVVPADKNLAGAAVELVLAENREYKLQALLNEIRDRYKFIVLDCPPALDLLTLNALVSASSVLVPIQCEYLALEGVSELLDTLMRIRRTLNPSLEIEGILLTMYDERTTLSRQVATDLRSFFGMQVFQSVIPRNVRLAEAPSFGKPIIFYDIHSKGAEGYTQLAQEVIANDAKRSGPRARSADSGA